MTKLKRAALFSDIHWGRKNNSKTHNQDCLKFINWFVDNVKNIEADHIVFLGDWFEERDSINSLTQKYAMDGAHILNSLDIPLIFIVGNHDLYYRDSRDVYASYIYGPLSNFTVIDSPIVIQDTLTPTLYTPYLFEYEYPDLTQYLDIPIWIGHFEFKGFVLTGSGIVKETGPDPDDFTSPDHILSGHFHKRQNKRNITYIGNCFPMDFGDANDFDRGMAVLDYESNELQFINWNQCPRYISTTLSELSENEHILTENSRVKCLADVDITFNENVEIKNRLMEKYKLREFNIEEKMNIMVSDGELSEEEIKSESTTVLVRKLLGKIEADKIDNKKLIGIYDEL